MFIIGYFLSALATVLNYVLIIFMWVVIARAILSWVSPDPYNPIVRFIHNVTEPVLYPIRRKLPVTMVMMTVEQARDAGAAALFANKYGEQVKVFTVGDFSTEVCGGPHAANTSELGHFRIVKEGSSSAGVRRIRAVLE